MATVNSILTNFTAGELSPRVYGRVDLAKYQNGARELRNIVSLPQGGARKRGGTLFIATVKDESARLVKFEYSTQQAYQLEFGENYIRFFKDRASIADAQFEVQLVTLGVVTTTIRAIGHTFVNGDPVILTGIVGPARLNNREFKVAGVTADEFNITLPDGTTLDTTEYGAYVSGGVASRIYEVATSYTADDVAALNFTQSADTLFIFSSRWPIAKLVRHDHADWTIETGNVEEGPFLDMNTDETNTVSVDVVSGAGVMTFTLDTLEESHIGALFRIWEYANGETFGYATWAPGANVTVVDNSFWEYKGNVYQVVSGGGQTLSPSAAFPTHTQGTATIYYGASGGSAQMRYEHSGYAVVQITDVVDTKNALVNVVKNRVPFTAFSARSSPQWQEGAWSDKNGYPTSGTFHEQRLVAAGTEHQPSTYWGSVINAYLKYKDGDKDDDSYTYTISSDKVDAVKFMESTKRLNLFATGGEYIGQATSTNEAITPTNIKTSPETAFGTAENVKPLRAGPAVLFAQRKGKNENAPRRVREFVYNFQTDSFTAPDLTILADHITYPGLVRGAFIASPDVMIWYAKTDGALCALTYERDQQVVGWHGHYLGGDGLVRDLSPLPGDTGDDLWMIVEREINGATVRYIEVLTQGLEDGGALEDAFFLDCGLSYDGSATSTISGLWHLEGETVSALADGVPVHDLEVTDSAITLPDAASKVHVGYPYTSRLKTLRIEAGAQGGTAQGQIGRVFEIIARLQNSLGGKFGRDNQEELDPIPYRDESATPITEPIPLFSGDKVLPFDGEWDRERFVVIEHSEPLPFTLTALVVSQRISG